jgi:hypothetical protein
MSRARPRGWKTQIGILRAGALLELGLRTNELLGECWRLWDPLKTMRVHP